MSRPIEIGELLRRERLVMASIRRGARRGLPPTHRQIVAESGLTKNQVCYILRRLRAQGRIKTYTFRAPGTHCIQPANLDPPAPIVPPGLTGWRKEIAAFYARYQAASGRPPSITEVDAFLNPGNTWRTTTKHRIWIMAGQGILIAVQLFQKASTHMLPVKGPPTPTPESSERMSQLTQGQYKTLLAIRDLTEKLSYPPTTGEIANHTGTSISNTWRYLNSLEARGWIARDRKTLSGRVRARTIRITRDLL